MQKGGQRKGPDTIYYDLPSNPSGCGTRYTRQGTPVKVHPSRYSYRGTPLTVLLSRDTWARNLIPDLASGSQASHSSLHHPFFTHPSNHYCIRTLFTTLFTMLVFALLDSKMNCLLASLCTAKNENGFQRQRNYLRPSTESLCRTTSVKWLGEISLPLRFCPSRQLSGLSTNQIISVVKRGQASR